MAILAIIDDKKTKPIKPNLKIPFTPIGARNRLLEDKEKSFG
jgi:hypothetical protein